MKDKFINIISILLIIICCINIAVTLVDYERKIDFQDNHIKLLQDELKNVLSEKEYYQKQYKKYFELSEELQNQLGVYLN
ncbi:hypothetical protein [Thomasclavelia spiroformis]|uniref:hypothetical protein n=1 Tax=Thomasclavelia spiroformis TaxID=29348 RepID=UPI0024320814|nr:hypothetical protein [Thomasclavelia spiroformis]